MKIKIVLTLASALIGSTAVYATPEKTAIIETYSNIAYAMYEDALSEARNLDRAIKVMLLSPGPRTLRAARAAWIKARVPYMQTEVYRFGNSIVDDWEGKVNAWPLDEGLIDYVDPAYGAASDENPLYVANIVANKKFPFGGKVLDASKITPALLSEFHEIGGVEANVAIGYHAIEFLLWGQDLNGTSAGNGDRPWTDYATGDVCSHGNCGRRGRYLKVAGAMLVDELEWMRAQWATGGAARKSLTDKGHEAALSAMLTGLGSLSYGELAGERIKLGFLLHDPEEEQDCFSDNTHNSHYYDVMGMLAVYQGSYMRIDGSKVSGPSLSALVAGNNAALNREMRDKFSATQVALARLKARAETVEAYDQMIGKGNLDGNALVQAVIDRLTEQTRVIERVVAALGLQPIELEGSDSLDDPAKVFE